MDRIPITITNGEMTDFSIAARAVPQEPVPTPPQTQQTATPPITNTGLTGANFTPPVMLTEIIPGEPDNSLDGLGRLEIITRAALSGNPLSSGVFGIYSASDNRLVTELTTGADGSVYTELAPGGYFLQELRATFGFVLEPTRIFFEIEENGVVTVEITKERDPLIADVDAEGMIWIPPTGEDMSLFHYMGGTLLIALSAACGFLLLHSRKRRKPRRRYIRNYA
jgi:hypothetical protein